MVPAVAALINLIPGVVNSVGNMIKDKNKAKEETSKILPAFAKDPHNIADGLDISSKTVCGYGIGGVIIMYALRAPEENIWVLAIGAVIVIGTTVSKALERK